MKKRWSLVVSAELDKSLRTHLAQKGLKKGDLSRFVEKAVEHYLYDLSLDNPNSSEETFSNTGLADFKNSLSALSKDLPEAELNTWLSAYGIKEP